MTLLASELLDLSFSSLFIIKEGCKVIGIDNINNYYDILPKKQD